jgi:DNA-binding NtrC family response regulator
MEKLLTELLPGIGKGVRQSRREILQACSRQRPVIIAGESGTGKDHTAAVIHRLSATEGLEFHRIDLSRGKPSAVEHRSKVPRTVYLDHVEMAGKGADSFIRSLFRQAGAGSRLIFSVTMTAREEAPSAALLGLLDTPFSMVSLQPLRRRREDLPILMETLVKRHAPSAPLCLAPEDLDYLALHSWPGNLTELWGWLEPRVVASGTHRETSNRSLGKVLDAEIEAWVSSMSGQGSRVTDLLKKVTGRVEKGVIRAVLTRTSGNQSESAQILGINRNTLANKIKEYGLTAATRRAATSPRSREV